MRVLVLTAAYPSSSEPERAIFIENITRALLSPVGESAEPFLEATVIAPRIRKSDPLQEERRGVPVLRFPYPSRGRRLKEWGRPPLLRVGAWILSGIRTTLRELRQRGADLLLCHWVLPTGVVGAVASRLFRVPLVLIAHGSDVNRYAVSSRLARFLARRALRSATRVVAVSRDLEATLAERFGVCRERLSVLSMGVDESLFGPSETAGSAGRSEARARLGLDAATPVLLYVGDLLEEKGVVDLVQAHEGVRRSGLEVTLCLVGDGPMRAEMERRSAQGPGRLEVPGRVSQTSLVDWYRAADLLVLPSRSEGMPVTILEALTLGLPVVATRVGGIPEVVQDGKTGLLVEPGETQALESALRKALERETLEALREEAAASRPDFSAATRGRELQELLREVVGKRVSAGEAVP